jgi:hypothetical protein
VREVSINPLLAEYSDHVLLLRPDRYVAACIASADLDEGAEKWKTLWRALSPLSPAEARDPTPPTLSLG